MNRRIRWGAAVLPLVLQLVACRPAEPPSEPPSPEALLTPGSASLDLTLIDPVLRQQIELLQRALSDVPSAGGVMPGAASSEGTVLGERFGELGNAHHIAELLDAAAEAYERANRVMPGDKRWPYYLGMAHQSRGDMAKAAMSFEAVLELDPTDPAARMRWAESQLRLNRLSAARESFELATESEAVAAAAHSGLARIAAISGDPELAVRHFSQALLLDPEADSLHYPLAQAYLKLGDEERAKQHLERRGERPVGTVDPLADRLSQSKTLTAFSLIESLAGDPERLDDEDFLGFVTEQVGDVKGASDQLRHRLEQGSSVGRSAGEARVDEPHLDDLWRARMLYAIGGLQARQGADAEAAETFREAVDLNSTLRDARLRLANSLARLGQFALAEAQYSTLLESEPEDEETRLRRATARLRLERFGAAATDLHRVIASDPSNGLAHLRLGSVLRRLDDPSAARAAFERALESDLPAPEKAMAHRQLGRLAKESEDPETALAHLRALLALEPGVVEVQFHVGQLLIETRRYAEARTHFEAARVDRPGDARWTRPLARLLATCPEAALRDGTRAFDLADELFRSDPSLSNAETLAMALAETGRFDQAEAWQHKLLAEAVRLGHDDQVPRLEDALKRYQRGEAVRLPPSTSPL